MAEPGLEILGHEPCRKRACNASVLLAISAGSHKYRKSSVTEHRYPHLDGVTGAVVTEAIHCNTTYDV
jgi:hypothetical protein